MTSVESRLTTVERQLRFQRALAVFLLITLAGLVSYGAAEGVPEALRARKFVVVNEQGREVVVIGSSKSGGMVATYPAKGIMWPSVLIAHGRKGDGQLEISNKKNQLIIIAGAQVKGDGILRIADRAGKNGLHLKGLNKSGGGGGIELYASKTAGDRVVHIHADRTGNGIVEVTNPQGNRKTITAGQ